MKKMKLNILLLLMALLYSGWIPAQSSFTTYFSPQTENQIVQGPCYIFATVAAIEANAVKQGLDPVDLSEWFFYSECVNFNTSGGVPMMQNVLNQMEDRGGLLEGNFYKPSYTDGPAGCGSCPDYECNNPGDPIIPCQFLTEEDFCAENCIYGMDYFPATGTDPEFTFPNTDIDEIVTISDPDLVDYDLTNFNNEQKVDKIKELMTTNDIGVTLFVKYYSPLEDATCPGTSHAVYVYGWTTNSNDQIVWKYKDSWPCDASSNRQKVLSMSQVTRVVQVQATVAVEASCFAPQPVECAAIEGPTSISSTASYTLPGAPGATNIEWSATEGLDYFFWNRDKFRVSVESCAPPTATISVSYTIGSTQCYSEITVNLSSGSTLSPPTISVLSPNWNNNQTCPNTTLELNANYSGAASGVTYEWQIFGANLISGQGTSVAFVQTYNVPESVPLTFKVRAILPCGTSGWGVINGTSFSKGCGGKGTQARMQVTQADANGFQIISSDFEQQYAFTLFDLSGRIVASGEASNQKVVDISHLSSGVYFLQMETGMEPKIFRILK